MSFVADAIGGVVKAVGSIIGGVVNAVGAVVSGVINFVASPFLGMFGAPDVPDPGSGASSPTGVLVQRTGTDITIPVVYGQRKMAGHVAFATTGSTDNKYLWVAYDLCEGPIEGITEIYINDTAMTPAVVQSLNSQQKTSVIGAQKDYGGLVQLQFYRGWYFDNPDYTNVGSVIGNDIFNGCPEFTAKMNYNGVATIFARFEMPTSGDNPFGGSIPEIKVVVMGKLVERILPNRAGDVGTWSGITSDYEYAGESANPRGYSYNPADCLLDYLRNPRYGKGLSNEDIDWESWRIAAEKCRTLVSYQYGSGQVGPVMTFNYVVNTESTLFNNVQDMLKQFRAYMPYNNGSFKLKIEDGGNETDITSSSYPVAATFNKDNIVGNITYTGIDRSSKYNVVTVKYIDPDLKWTEQIVTYPSTETERVELKTADGGRENKGEFTFSAIISKPIAQDYARMILRKNREQDTLSFAVTSQGFELEVGDIIYVDANILKFGTVANQSGTVGWRIVSIKFNNDYTFMLGCVRHIADIYPYVRSGGYVYKAGVWVPKGASLYYPPEPSYIGLIQPGNASRFGTTPIPWQSFTTNSGNAVTVNDTPPVQTQAAPLTDVVSIFKAAFVPLTATSAFCELYFRQPANTMYDKTSFYYKRDIASETNFTQVDNFNKVGANNILTQRIGPLIVGQTYIIKAIVRYTTGDNSSAVDIIRVTPTATATELDPTDSSEAAYTGWVLPTAIPANNRSAIIRSATAFPILTGSTVTNPRGLTFSVLQDIDTYGQNNYATGMQIFYKLSGATYWRSTNWSFGGGYTAGVSTPTFNWSDFGSRVNPGTPGNESLYDIVLRYTYNDNAASIYQARFLQVPVEKAGTGTNAYDALALATTTIKSELITDYNLVLESASPAGATGNALNIVVGVRSIYARPSSDGVNTMRVFIQQPNVADIGNWYGITVYYRKKQVGVLTPYTKLEFFPIPKSTSGEYSVVIPNIDYISDYEMIINARVSYQGTAQDATYALYGSFRSSNPGPNIIAVGSGQFSLLYLSDALKTLTTIPNDPEPVASVLSWKRVFTSYTDLNKQGWQYDYYNLKLLLPASNYNAVYIGRREKTSNPYAPPYYGIGKWEYIKVTTNNTTNESFAPGMNLTISSNILEINMRRPTGVRKFTSNYVSGGTVPLLDSRFTVFEPPIAGEQNHEFVVWLEKTDASRSKYLLKLPTLNKVALTASVKGDVNAVIKEECVTYDNYNNAYERNLNQADIWRDSWRDAPTGYNITTWNKTYLPGGTNSVSTFSIPDTGSKVL